jgi:hypothetical protein
MVGEWEGANGLVPPKSPEPSELARCRSPDEIKEDCVGCFTPVEENEDRDGLGACLLSPEEKEDLVAVAVCQLAATAILPTVISFYSE